MATGLAFATPIGKMSPSLRNILKEVHNSHDVKYNDSYDTSLTEWAKSGVLLINRTLTVRKGSQFTQGYMGWLCQRSSKAYHTQAEQRCIRWLG